MQIGLGLELRRLFQKLYRAQKLGTKYLTISYSMLSKIWPLVLKLLLKDYACAVKVLSFMGFFLNKFFFLLLQTDKVSCYEKESKESN